MPPFPKPRFAYEYDLAREVAALRAYPQLKRDRKIPCARSAAQATHPAKSARLPTCHPRGASWKTRESIHSPATLFSR